MKYFIDFEFIEGFNQPLFGKCRHFIDLISVGIVAEDGREYYAISNEYNYNDASDWVRKNVINQIYREQCSSFKQQFMNVKTFHKHIPNGKSNKKIVIELLCFLNGYAISDIPGKKFEYVCNDSFYSKTPTEFYGYFSAYDWVLFCSLFGTMANLPKGFPMYCKDLKQMKDARAKLFRKKLCERDTFDDSTLEAQLSLMEQDEHYPKISAEHNALADARFNRDLYHFLKDL